VTVILLVTGMVTLCIVFIAANTASMSIRERVGEIAVMKALGFRWRVLFGTLVLEAALLATLAGVAGSAITLGLAQALKSIAGFSPQLGPLASFVVTNAILVEGLFLACFIGILSGLIPAFGASRRSVAATLREVF
jgi:putative ABC transport system permease protein